MDFAVFNGRNGVFHAVKDAGLARELVHGRFDTTGLDDSAIRSQVAMEDSNAALLVFGADRG